MSESFFADPRLLAALTSNTAQNIAVGAAIVAPVFISFKKRFYTNFFILLVCLVLPVLQVLVLNAWESLNPDANTWESLSSGLFGFGAFVLIIWVFVYGAVIAVIKSVIERVKTSNLKSN
jgi:predicted ABC-type exoprotein transport system permease subunit